MMGDTTVNAAYYLYQDKYTFWYKFISDTDEDFNFSILPTNRTDRYEVIVYEFEGKNFCEALVNQNLKAMSVKQIPLVDTSSAALLYKNIIHVKKGGVYYLSVLSLNEDDCGHKLYMEEGGRELAINAIHRPCYNVSVIREVPDYKAGLMDMPEDVSLDIKSLDKGKKNSKQYQGNHYIDQKGMDITTKSIKTLKIDAVNPERIQAGDKFIAYNVAFYHDTYAMKPGDNAQLDEMVSFMKDNPKVLMEVQGYMDQLETDITPDSANFAKGEAWNFKGTSQKLSELRARTVRDYLLAKGISQDRLTYRGYDTLFKRFPKANTEEQHQKNERIEFKVIITGK